MTNRMPAPSAVCCDPWQERKFISAADMDRRTPNERADAVNASICHSWDEVPEPHRSKFLAEIDEMARRLKRSD